MTVATDHPLRTRYVLAWMSPTSMIPSSLVPIRRAIEDQVKEPPEQVEIDVWLESPGGDAHTAYKLALMLRHAACHVRVVVPDFAKSAATLLALGGHEIYMAPGAELGPLDAQMPEEGSLEGSMSALNIAHAADEVARDAVELAEQGTAEIFQQTGLSRAETVTAMLDFSAKFSEPLLRQLDPRVVYHAKEMLRVTKHYAEVLLTPTIGERAGRIASSLVESFPTHGYVICIEQATQLGLPISPLSDYDHADEVRVLHRASEDGNPIVAFSPMSEIFGVGGDDEDDDGETGFEGRGDVNEDGGATDAGS